MDPQLLDLTRRTIDHAVAGTVPLASSIHRVPARQYVDPRRWEEEMTSIFKRVPVVLGCTADVAEPGAYLSVDIAGVPILVSRGGDGTLRSFINSCSHRGARLVAPGMGTARRFVCPYHSWSYDSEGLLVGILDRADFGPLEPECLGLESLWVEERSGLIFGLTAPGRQADLDQWLMGYDLALSPLGLADCTVIGRQQIDGPNWKVAFDGYLDFYHLPILHKNSFGPSLSNKAIYDAWGAHQRVSSPDRRMAALDQVAVDDWPTHDVLSGVFTLFPHVSIASFGMNTGTAQAPRHTTMYMVSQLLPGPTVDCSRTIQYFLAADPIVDRATVDDQMEFLLTVVRDEDYATGFGIQSALAADPERDVLFGRNEAGGQRFHQWVDALLHADDDSDLEQLLAAASTDFQR